MQVPDSWINDAVNTVLAAIVGGVAWAIRNTWGRLRRLEDCTVRKKEFNELENKVNDSVVHKDQFTAYCDRAESDRRDLRDGIVKLFDKVDEIKTILIGKNTDG